MLAVGQTVKTVYGEWIEVLSIWDNMVTDTRGSRWHISKLLVSTAK